VRQRDEERNNPHSAHSQYQCPRCSVDNQKNFYLSSTPSTTSSITLLDYSHDMIPTKLSKCENTAVVADDDLSQNQTSHHNRRNVKNLKLNIPKNSITTWKQDQITNNQAKKLKLNDKEGGFWSKVDADKCLLKTKLTMEKKCNRNQTCPPPEPPSPPPPMLLTSKINPFELDDAVGGDVQKHVWRTRWMNDVMQKAMLI